MFRKLGAIAVALAFIAGVTACMPESEPAQLAKDLNMTEISPSSEPTDECPDEEAALPPGAVATTGTVTDPSGATADDLLAYLQSPERVARYKALAEKAGPLIAVHLTKGRFGAIEVYGEQLNEISDDYEGWGGIQASPLTDDADFFAPVAYAYVWWDGDGTIDPGKSVYEMRITNVNDPDGSAVMISSDVFLDDREPIWESYRKVGCDTISVYDIYEMVSLDGWGSSNPSDRTQQPASLAEVKQFDDEAIAQFEANMDSWNLDGWE